jgi:ankyrin repeat protein
MTKVLQLFTLTTLLTTTLFAAPIHDAVVSNDLAWVKQLINEDSTCVNAKDDDGLTPLHYAVFHNRIDDDLTPLHDAAFNNYISLIGRIIIVKHLLSYGADVNVRDNGNATMLHHAASQDCVDTVGLLLACGAEVNARDGTNGTPLHRAANFGNAEIVGLLLARGAKMNARDRSSLTPLHYAAFNTQVEVVELLLEKGAGVNAQNRHGLTPLDLAWASNHAAVIECLIMFPLLKSLHNLSAPKVVTVQ